MKELGLKDSSRDFQVNCAISFYFRLYLILHAYTVRFDVMGNLEKNWFLGALNKALDEIGVLNMQYNSLDSQVPVQSHCHLQHRMSVPGPQAPQSHHYLSWHVGTLRPCLVHPEN